MKKSYPKKTTTQLNIEKIKSRSNPSAKPKPKPKAKPMKLSMKVAKPTKAKSYAVRKPSAVTGVRG